MPSPIVTKPTHHCLCFTKCIFAVSNFNDILYVPEVGFFLQLSWICCSDVKDYKQFLFWPRLVNLLLRGLKRRSSGLEIVEDPQFWFFVKLQKESGFGRLNWSFWGREWIIDNLDPKIIVKLFRLFRYQFRSNFTRFVSRFLSELRSRKVADKINKWKLMRHLAHYSKSQIFVQKFN